MLAIGFVFIAFRLYARVSLVGVRKLAWDDALMWVALVSISWDLIEPQLRLPLVANLSDSLLIQRKRQQHISSAHTGWVLQTAA